MDRVTITKDQLRSVTPTFVADSCVICGGPGGSVLHEEAELGCKSPNEHHTYNSEFESIWKRLKNASNSNLSSDAASDRNPFLSE